MDKKRDVIIAGIITYNPDIDLLEKNIKAVLKQVSNIVIVDNMSQNRDEIVHLLNNVDILGSVQIICNNTNKGIAYALNQVLEYGREKDYKWALTMDQDSILVPGIIDEYLQCIEIENVGMIACDFVDRHSNVDRGAKKEKYEFVNKCITSGTLTNIKICLDLGGFDNNMFIDYVDFDMCVRLLKYGYKILQVNSIGISHTIGEAKPLKLFGNEVKIAGNVVEIYNESPTRVYYFFRNLVYFIRKHKKWSKGYTSWLHIIWRAFIVIWFEKPKIIKLKMLKKGLREGFKMEV